jgi:hypothetical protein
MKLNLNELNAEYSDAGGQKNRTNMKPKKSRETEFETKHRAPKKVISRETLRRQPF